MLNLRGKTLVKLDRGTEARQAFDQALAIDPQNAQTHHVRGTLLLAAGESAAAVEHLLEARRLDPITKNDADALALGLGRQLAPFRWLAPLVLRWYRWKPKATWAMFMLLALAYVSLWYAFPRKHGAGGIPPMCFGVVVVNLMLLPFSFDVLAKGAALWVKRRTIGAPGTSRSWKLQRRPGCSLST